MWGWFDATAQATLSKLATLAQFTPALVLAFVPLRSRRALLAACLVVVLSFMQFGKVFSPQWIVWLAPLAILVGSQARAALLLLVLCDLLTWLHMPLFFYEYVGNPAYGAELSRGLSWSISLRIVALALFWAWSLWTLLRTLGRPPDTAATPNHASP